MEFEASLSTAIEKRDRVGQFMVHLEQQIDFAKFEIERLRQRQGALERALERSRTTWLGRSNSLGTDARGSTCGWRERPLPSVVRACPPSVEVTDESAFPPSTRCSR